MYNKGRTTDVTGRRCFRNSRYIALSAGCHHFSVMHAHAGGRHGVTLRLQTRHNWKCAKHNVQRIPSRFIRHPLKCDCSDLPPDRPLELDPVPIEHCPTGEFGKPGWELCAWPISGDPSSVAGATDLEGNQFLDVCSVSQALRVWLHRCTHHGLSLSCCPSPGHLSKRLRGMPLQCC